MIADGLTDGLPARAVQGQQGSPTPSQSKTCRLQTIVYTLTSRNNRQWEHRLQRPHSKAKSTWNGCAQQRSAVRSVSAQMAAWQDLSHPRASICPAQNLAEHRLVCVDHHRRCDEISIGRLPHLRLPHSHGLSWTSRKGLIPYMRFR